MAGNRAQTSILDEIIVDNFAGGGGASTGIELATGRVVDIAINHDPDAILMHKTNHPYTEHLQASVWDVDVEAVCRGRPVGLAWFSPDCKHFSKAKGGPLVSKNIRGLSWVVIKWCLATHPRVILMENVEEIQTWGPLIPVLDPKTRRPLKIVTYLRNGKPRQKTVVAKEGEVVPEDQLAMMPDPERKGETFQGFLSILTTGIAPDHPALLECCKFLQIAPDSDDAKRLIKGLGYDVEHKELVAADYGAPTTRKRFVLVAHCDGRPIVWPKRTHAPADSPEVKSGKLKPWRSAAEIIDWSIPCPSIFETKDEILKKYGIKKAVRPLVDNTQRRAIRGVDKYTIKSARPFIVPTGYGERSGQEPRTHSIDRPLPTVVGSGKGNLPTEPVNTVTSSGGQSLVTAHIAEFKGQDVGQNMHRPLRTITASWGEFAAVYTRIVKYAPGADLGYWPQIRALLNKHCGYTLADDEVLLLNIGGVWYFISDIGLRMLTPKELYAAMGFPLDYIIDRDYTGKPYPKSAQVARCGNAVCPPMATAVVRANLPEWCEGIQITTMLQLGKLVAV